MSLEGALLGMISSMGPITGYDLTKAFRLSMAHYWHARHGQIYPTLDVLRRKGMVTSRTQVQHDRPNKKLYTITEKGRTALLRWLRLPAKPLQMKHEGLLKCRFYAQLPEEEAMTRLGNERTQYRDLLEHYRDLEQIYFGGRKDYANPDAMFGYFTLRRGIMFLEESIRWCDWAMAELKRYGTKRKRPARRQTKVAASTAAQRRPRGVKKRASR